MIKRELRHPLFVHGAFCRRNSQIEESLNNLGYERDDIRNLSFEDLLENNDLNKAYELTSEILKTGKQSKPSEFRIKSKNGSYLYVEAYGVPLKKNGETYAILGIAKNVTAHKKALQQLKDSEEMLKLLDKLLVEYTGCRRIYLSWDAASWHSSKIFVKKVKAVNRRYYRERHNTPMVKLAPLPARAQFLNVIESIFSGLSEAIIKNSDYASIDEAISAIDLYFDERNDFFQQNPGRAGNKIWGEEIVKPLFKLGQNCKHPRCR